MANTTRKQPKPQKVSILFHDRGLLERIDAYATESRRTSRSNAIESLVAEALDARAKAAS